MSWCIGTQAQHDHTATHCNTLQHAATYRNALQHTEVRYAISKAAYHGALALRHNMVTLQHTATHCNALLHTATVIQKMLPACAYTPCIEEHNIHAIFWWSSVWSIFEASESHDVRMHASADEFVSPGTASMVGFLKDTGLTLSVTTLGTCIYRFGKKRCRETYGSASDESSLPTTNNIETENRIFKMCKYIHAIVSTS